MKSEFRKLFTVRSTYILIILSAFFVILFAGYFEGYKGNTGSPAAKLEITALHEIVVNSAGLGVIFASIIAALFMAHEYRYNTIMYTLTANAHRTRVLLAKVITATLFGIAYGLLIFGLALGSYQLGLTLRDATLPAQNFELLNELGKVVFYYAAYALAGLLIATVARSVLVAIASLLIIPTTIEPLIGLLLKDNAKYLPFASLDSVINISALQNALSSGTAMVVASLYLAAGLVITWALFMRRDAN